MTSWNGFHILLTLIFGKTQNLFEWPGDGPLKKKTSNIIIWHS